MRVWEQPVPGYYLEKLLWRATAAEVWKATGPGDVPCAVKVVGLDKTFTPKAFRAVELAQRVRHPNLVPVYGAWLKDPDGVVLAEDAAAAAIRMGRADRLLVATGPWDRTLADRLRESPAGLPAAELLRYVDDAARGIDHLNKPVHDLGDGKAAIVHGNVKPANLVLFSDAVQVCDYGFATLPAVRKACEEVGGSPWYAPVEQLNNAPAPQSDQFSLALTYYELRTGRLPFDKSRAMVAILLGQLDLSAVSEAEQVVLRRATTAHPAKRYPTCREMVEALRKAVTDRPVRLDPAPPAHRPPEPPRPVAAVGALSVTVAVESGPPETPSPSGTPALAPGGGPPAERYPDRVGDYELVRLLGEGGMGAVFEARDLHLGRPVAVKLILPAHATNPDARARFLREAKSQAMVRNDHVVPIYHAGDRDGVLFLVMPLLSGETLERRLRRPPVPLGLALKVGREAADGLAAAHHQGLMHRDVKPSNLWLEGDPAGDCRRCVVLDFGLARRMATTTSHAITVDRAILGTPAYMSPEQAGDGVVDARTDVYSLGVVLYQMLTGTQPFESKDLVGSLFKVATVVPPPAAEVNPAVPPELSDLVARMTAKAADRRPRTAAEVAAELTRITAAVGC